MHIQGYSKLLYEHQAQVEQHLKCAPQVTLLMVMPHTINLEHLPRNHHLKPYQRMQVNETMGIGFSRLCAQLTSNLMGLSSIWLLDDNISDCWRLPFETFANSGGTHGDLQSVKFDQVMKTIESQVSMLLHHNASLLTFSNAQMVKLTVDQCVVRGLLPILKLTSRTGFGLNACQHHFQQY